MLRADDKDELEKKLKEIIEFDVDLGNKGRTVVITVVKGADGAYGYTSQQVPGT